MQTDRKKTLKWTQLMYLVTYIVVASNCQITWIYNMYQKIWRYQKYKSNYICVWVKSILLHMQKTRSSYHIRTLSNGSSKWVNFKRLFWPKHSWGASGFQGGLEFWIILFSLQTLAALYCIMIIRSHIKDNIAVPWAIKNSKNACQMVWGATFDPP